DNDCACFQAHVSSGTYIRSIAHEMGRELGCGAHLASLRRTVVAEFTLSDAHTLDEIEDAAKRGQAGELFIHPRRLLPKIPSVSAPDEVISAIRNGRAVNLPELSQSKFVKVFRGQAELVSVSSRIAGTLFHPAIVFAISQSGT